MQRNVNSTCRRLRVWGPKLRLISLVAESGTVAETSERKATKTSNIRWILYSLETAAVLLQYLKAHHSLLPTHPGTNDGVKIPKNRPWTQPYFRWKKRRKRSFYQLARPVRRIRQPASATRQLVISPPVLVTYASIQKLVNTRRSRRRLIVNRAATSTRVLEYYSSSKLLE